MRPGRECASTRSTGSSTTTLLQNSIPSSRQTGTKVCNESFLLNYCHLCTAFMLASQPPSRGTYLGTVLTYLLTWEVVAGTTGRRVETSVVDPDPDPYVFGPPGSGSTSQRYGSGSRSGSFYQHAKIVRKTLFLLFCDPF